jgi:hypothetical protein
MAENDVFSPDNAESSAELGLNDLVGEGRKYKTPDDLAKAYANVEGHAKTLERENAEIRARLDVIEANPNPPNEDNRGREPAGNEDNRQPPPNQAPKPSGDEFRSQIRDEVKALNEAERVTANIEAAAKRMVEVYGDTAKANEAVTRRAAELGVSVDWLKDSAGRSPSAFYATMGISQGSSHSTPASGGNVRMDSSSPNVKNFEYYDKIRKENPKLYFSTATQTEMMAEARNQGSDFYKR